MATPQFVVELHAGLSGVFHKTVPKFPVEVRTSIRVYAFQPRVLSRRQEGYALPVKQLEQKLRKTNNNILSSASSTHTVSRSIDWFSPLAVLYLSAFNSENSAYLHLTWKTLTKQPCGIRHGKKSMHEVP